jgi:glutathione S-transferase
VDRDQLDLWRRLRIYKLFWSPGSAAIAPHVCLEEIGVPFELIRLDTKAGEHKRTEYLRLNPHGRIPTLIVDGVPVYESAAICMLLAERHPGARLAPAPGSPLRGTYLQWQTYLTNTIQERFLQYFHPDWYMDEEIAFPALKSGATTRIAQMFERIDTALAANGPFFCGTECTTADIFLAMLVRWSRNMARPGWAWPAVKRNCDSVVARPACQRMLATQGIAWNA